MLHLQPRRRRGFTFLEIMFVVVIIGILLALVGPRLAGRTQQARVTATNANLNSIATAIKTFEMDNGSYPDRLDDLIEPPSDYEDSWNGPYLDKDAVPTDEWKQEFEYKIPGDNNKRGFDLWSKGPDKQSRTDDDIVNWTKKE